MNKVETEKIREVAAKQQKARNLAAFQAVVAASK
jgi:hypothetical protein